MRHTRLGSFMLESPLGRGGMGEVWRARHVEQGATVALKIMTAAAARQRKFVEAFHREVRASVGLDHPNIARVYDLGTIPEGSGPGMVAGSPYLVMEYLPGGSLEPQAGRTRWPEIQETLLAILAALGHAHARGILHRDVKPANVLLAEDGSLRLVDFGLAGPVDDPGADRLNAGSPRYASPEQLQGRWRDQGPWTDLYALGRTALALLMGSLNTPWMPPPVPPGFILWLSRMLQADPSERFQRAADARYALLRVEGGEEDERPPVVEAGPQALLDMARGEVRVPPVRRVVPQMQEIPDLRRIETTPPMGLGLAVYALRPVPFVGRVAMRRRLWERLREVRQNGRPRLVILQGPSGTGKSRLADWLCARAEETGAALALKAPHTPESSGGEEIGRMLSRHFGCEGLPYAMVNARMERILAAEGVHDAYERGALAGIVSPGGVASTFNDEEAGEAPIHFERPEDRYLVIVRALKRMARIRPLILWLDDAQWGPDALGLAEQILDIRQGVQALVVLTVRDDAVAERRQAALRIEHLSRNPSAERLILGPLPPEEHEELLGQLGLRGELARRVAGRTEGNPLFAVQLVRDWVQRDRLTPGEEGLALQGDSVDLPDDLHAVWRARVDRLLAGLPPKAEGMLERAAILGQEVPAEDWAEVCDGIGGRNRTSTELRDRLSDRMVAGKLAAARGDGWAFVHGMLRGSLERRAREGGRLAEHHRACADLLLSRPGSEERAGYHLLHAGEAGRALDVWIKAAEERIAAGDGAGAQRLVDQAESALTPPEDPRRFQVMHFKVEALFLLGDRGAIPGILDELEQAGREAGDAVWAIRAALARGRLLLGGGNLTDALARYEDALALAEREPVVDPVLDGICRMSLAGALVNAGAAGRARKLYTQALDRFEKAGVTRYEALAWRGLATALRQEGRLAEAAGCFRHALAQLEVLGHRRAVIECWSGIGDACRLSGDLFAAEQAYQEALAGSRSLGTWHASVIRVNLALIRVETGRFEEAGRTLAEELAGLDEGRLGWLAAVAHAALLPCAASEADFTKFTVHLDRSVALVAATRFADVDLARVAEQGGEMISGTRPDLARRALAFAEEQRRAIGHTDEAERLVQRIARISA